MVVILEAADEVTHLPVNGACKNRNTSVKNTLLSTFFRTFMEMENKLHDNDKEQNKTVTILSNKRATQYTCRKKVMLVLYALQVRCIYKSLQICSPKFPLKIIFIPMILRETCHVTKEISFKCYFRSHLFPLMKFKNYCFAI